MRINWNNASSITKLQLDGKTIFNQLNQDKKRPAPNGVSFFKNLSEPTTVQIAVSGDSELPTFNFTFLKMGLPTHLIESYKPRKPYMMPTAHWNSNTTLWQASVNPDTLDVR
ncbi:MAG: hypothetical protein U5J63_10465 [Fodinibius sp.]|nr:hypothetical protein [Fodinibius sp.]